MAQHHPDPEKMAITMGEDARALTALLGDATAVQWERSRAVATVEDAGITSKGTLSRPTEDIALDPKRLALRAEVTLAARLLVSTSDALHRQLQRLTRALDQWNGDPPEG